MIIVIGVGTLGYKFLSEAYSWIDALYMTIITTTTVGFGEVHPSGNPEKLFTIFLIITSISIYGYVLSVISEYVADGRFIKQISKRKMQKKINKLHGHTLICGFGRNGKQAAEKLQSYDKQCVIIESDPVIIEEIQNTSFLYVKGDATDDSVLKSAQIQKASNLITTMPSDADNLYVVLSARQLNPGITIISRASNDTSYSKLKVAGANNVIMPDIIGGNHMASLIVSPDLVEFVERISLGGKENTNLLEIAVDDLPSEYISKSLIHLDLRKKTGCLAIGFKNAKQEYSVNPDANTILEPGSHLIVLGNHKQIKKLHDIL